MMVAIALVFVDHNFSYLDKARGWMTVAVTPLQWLADAPLRMLNLTNTTLKTRTELQTDMERLQAKNLVLEQQLQKFAELSSQNQRLRKLLNSSKVLNERILVSDVIGIDPNPNRQQLLINKGSKDRVKEGTPMLDAYGVMGQVVFVAPFSSRVMLITDTKHQVPVVINRSGLRSIAAGLGQNGLLELLNLSNNSDVLVGDLVLTSGLGGRFPPGYPIGQVMSVEKDRNQSFAKVLVKPTAHVNRSRNGLLIFAQNNHKAIEQALEESKK